MMDDRNYKNISVNNKSIIEDFITIELFGTARLLTGKSKILYPDSNVIQIHPLIKCNVKYPTPPKSVFPFKGAFAQLREQNP